MVMIKDDKTIKRNIMKHLAWDARVNVGPIDVVIEDGAVQLKGMTATYGERMAAYEDVWAVPGVVSVQNQLVVTPPDDFVRPTDDEIQDNIEAILRLHPALDSFNIEPIVNDGYVELRGTVDAYWKKQRAESMIADIAGVIDIQNKISVEPEELTPDDAVADMVEQALASNVYTDVSKIRVSVESGLVTLSGTVPTWNAYGEAYQSAL
jgi:osmotically-inducible protein OsmY